MRNQQVNTMSNQTNESARTIERQPEKLRETLKELEYEYMHGHKCNFMGEAFEDENIRFEE
ncbi:MULTISPECIES: hypothetical protein [unclassified Fusibacter]|uniref:hypothetical protein n=1 Tax=unclassified Fusibacter TaxID=2624464 RepID=UPI0010123F66|nr:MULTISPECIES: hypothetical protein [unclassified Fusibacter]MCK8059187.1 hypothetical protein [Fusibacter sp. A2]NPE22596.1 hypothetical protein [Fusibacter sp. A1]RXV60697.1 hypothetical protein DWB64_12165 [Fusibacter sp. A1]